VSSGALSAPPARARSPCRSRGGPPAAGAVSPPPAGGTDLGALRCDRRGRDPFWRTGTVPSAPAGSSAPTKETGASPLRGACAGARRPWPCWGCFRAAEPCALATAVTPSFAERRRPAKPRV